MKFITFLGSRPVHAADELLSPLCGQTDGRKHRRVQQVITSEPTCGRCQRLLALSDKNGPAARDRRRFLATRQALRDGRVGVEHFNRRTTDLASRERAAALLDAELIKLKRLYFALLRPPSKSAIRNRQSAIP